jgi:hypothetical protein
MAWRGRADEYAFSFNAFPIQVSIFPFRSGHAEENPITDASYIGLFHIRLQMYIRGIQLTGVLGTPLAIEVWLLFSPNLYFYLSFLLPLLSTPLVSHLNFAISPFLTSI